MPILQRSNLPVWYYRKLIEARSNSVTVDIGLVQKKKRVAHFFYAQFILKLQFVQPELSVSGHILECMNEIEEYLRDRVSAFIVADRWYTSAIYWISQRRAYQGDEKCPKSRGGEISGYLLLQIDE